ncbi:MAG TPA: YggS family pyridoxal phosphate-dependent enzyme [Candidatus Binatia bacterium]|nr:YggS family pyridoxal phosphate-dependent enzyme [Candidatus Binatia bacterium]
MTLAAIAERYRAVVERAAQAAIRAGRRPADITVVVAAKSFDVEAVRAAVTAGAEHVGENYVQEAREKARRLAELPIRWHMIGRLQRNKAKQAVALFDLVHSLDSIELASALDRAAAEASKIASCLVEVNVGAERTKAGVAIDELEALLEHAAALPNLRIRGLMTIPPPGTASAARASFARLRALRDRHDDLRLPNVQLKELSMGMSSDFEQAIAEGATLVRVGTAIFGPRR